MNYTYRRPFDHRLRRGLARALFPLRHDGSGALTLSVLSIAGTGVETFTATAALILSTIQLEGTGIGGSSGVSFSLVRDLDRDLDRSVDRDILEC